MQEQEKQQVKASPIEPVVMWTDETTNIESGFYATLYSWDSREGSFCDTNYFDGSDWREDRPICEIAGPFNSEDAADKWCEDNDISW